MSIETRENVDFMSILPQEIIDHIFTFVEWRDMENSGFVSKVWREKVLVSYAWRIQCIREGHQVKQVPGKNSKVKTSAQESETEMHGDVYRKLFYKAKNISENLSDNSFYKTRLALETLRNFSYEKEAITLSDDYVVIGNYSHHCNIFYN